MSKLYTEAGKITGTAFFTAPTSIIPGAGAGVGAGEDDPPPEAVALLLEASSFWEFALLLMRAQYLGIPSVPLERVWGPVCGWLGALPGAKAPMDEVTLWRYRVDIVPNVPKCPVPG